MGLTHVTCIFTAGRCGRAAITQEEVRRKCIERNYPAPSSHPLGICFRFGRWRWWLVWWCKKRFDSAPTEFSFRSLLIFGGPLHSTHWTPKSLLQPIWRPTRRVFSDQVASVVKCVMSRINSCSGWTRTYPLSSWGGSANDRCGSKSRVVPDCHIILNVAGINLANMIIAQHTPKTHMALNSIQNRLYSSVSRWPVLWLIKKANAAAAWAPLVVSCRP